MSALGKSPLRGVIFPGTSEWELIVEYLHKETKSYFKKKKIKFFVPAK